MDSSYIQVKRPKRTGAASVVSLPRETEIAGSKLADLPDEDRELTEEHRLFLDIEQIAFADGLRSKRQIIERAAEHTGLTHRYCKRKYEEAKNIIANMSLKMSYVG